MQNSKTANDTIKSVKTEIANSARELPFSSKIDGEIREVKTEPSQAGFLLGQRREGSIDAEGDVCISLVLVDGTHFHLPVKRCWRGQVEVEQVE